MLIALYADVNGFDKIVKIFKTGNNMSMMTTEIIATYTPQSEQNADEQTVNLDELISYVLQSEYVLGARAFEHNGTIVIATLTAPFYLKSERDSARAQMQEDLSAITGDAEVVLTFDMQVFRNIGDDLDAESKEYLLKLAKSR